MGHFNRIRILKVHIKTWNNMTKKQIFQILIQNLKNRFQIVLQTQIT